MKKDIFLYILSINLVVLGTHDTHYTDALETRKVHRVQTHRSRINFHEHITAMSFRASSEYFLLNFKYVIICS